MRNLVRANVEALAKLAEKTVETKTPVRTAIVLSTNPDGTVNIQDGRCGCARVVANTLNQKAGCGDSIIVGTEPAIGTITSGCPVSVELPPSPLPCPAEGLLTAVIDGNVTYLANAGGGIGDSWALARARAVADGTIDGEGVVSSVKTISGSPPPTYVWSIARSIMQFDTSVLADKIVRCVSVELFVRYPEDLRDVVAHITDTGTVVGPYPFDASEYGRVGATSFGSIHVVTGQYPDGTWVRIKLSPAAIPNLNRSGNSIFCVREAHDLNDVEPDPEAEGVALHRLFWLQADSSTCCRLVVKYQPLGPPSPPGGEDVVCN